MGHAFCKDCGTEIIQDDKESNPTEKNPCPKCGSTVRRYEVSVTAIGTATATVTASLIPHPVRLLSIARKLLDDGEFAISIVVMHMACEVSVARALTRAFQSRGIPDLEEPVEDFLSGYNLGNPRLRNLFNTMTLKAIHKEPFWKPFKESATRRNKIIHNGATATKAEAEDSFNATSELIKSLT